MLSSRLPLADMRHCPTDFPKQMCNVINRTLGVNRWSPGNVVDHPGRESLVDSAERHSPHKKNPITVCWFFFLVLLMAVLWWWKLERSSWQFYGCIINLSKNNGNEYIVQIWEAACGKKARINWRSTRKNEQTIVGCEGLSLQR